MPRMMVQSEMKGIKELEVNIRKLLKETGDDVCEKELMKDATILQKMIRGNIEKKKLIKTGALWLSIRRGLFERKKKDLPGVYVKVDKKFLSRKASGKEKGPYHQYLEYGTSKMGKKPYFRPVVRVFRRLAKTEGALKRIIKKYGSA